MEHLQPAWPAMPRFGSVKMYQNRGALWWFSFLATLGVPKINKNHKFNKEMSFNGEPSTGTCAKRGLKDNPRLPFTMDYLPHWARRFLYSPEGTSRFREGELELGVCATCMACSTQVGFYQNMQDVGGPNLIEFPGTGCSLEAKSE